MFGQCTARPSSYLVLCNFMCFAIKMYSCNFYLNKSSSKAQNSISCLKYICLIGTFLKRA